MKLNITYKIENDFKEVESCLKDSKFLIENNYIPILPKGVKLGEVFDEKVKLQIKKEFTNNQEKFSKVKDEIESDWQKVGKDFEKSLKKTFDSIPEIIYVSFTAYGPGGSYELPNEVLPRIESHPTTTFTENIAHEIVHLMIEEKILLNKVSHDDKENLVDWFFTQEDVNKIFPNYNFRNYSKPKDAQLEKIYPKAS